MMSDWTFDLILGIVWAIAIRVAYAGLIIWLALQ